jgi:23S rRNA (adenine2030-N6)-methyltransferase
VGAHDLPPALADYVDLVKGMNPSGKMRYYPGSPYVADKMTRPEDRLRLFELHPADSKILADNFRKAEAHKAEQGERARGKRVLIEYAATASSPESLLPPPSRRALVLIDPPYEVKLDYKHVRDALDDALGRFPTGIYAVWYPVLQRMESRQFPDRLKRLPAKDWLNVTLTVSTPGPDGTGLHSSGMFILNPPYTLEPTLREVLPYLVKVLGKDKGASFVIETGTQVTGAMQGHAARRRCGTARPADRQCAPRQSAVGQGQPAPAGPGRGRRGKGRACQGRGKRDIKPAAPSAKANGSPAAPRQGPAVALPDGAAAVHRVRRAAPGPGGKSQRPGPALSAGNAFV